MISYIIRFVETLKARIEPTGCSIHAALTIELPLYDTTTLLKLRDAAIDLHRILDLELGKRDEHTDDAMWTCWSCGEEMLAWQRGDHGCPAEFFLPKGQS